eukprot:CAMPEP_0181067156 /NCGR_PEP_ID=MMETSP1070-20121207/25720_1 /TAXON_ID=265543 /ORGANISM="Minutocellus polymorphus, Strain NH13" /LENGTH=336 /DNA_ID=CAMNT_0023147791 /DNA_START=75 /DNA_END=1081 /DNA_ORIENTATION=+
MTLLERIQCLDSTRHSASSEYATLSMDFNIVGHIQKSLFQKAFMDSVTPFVRDFGYSIGQNGVGDIIKLEVPLAMMSPNEKEKVELYSAKLDEIADYFVKIGIISRRHEDRYPVVSRGPIRKGIVWPSNEGRLIATIDRNLAPLFGIDSVGVHLLCFVKGTKSSDKDGGGPAISLWMAQRSAAKSSFPNKWDPTVAGGQPSELSLMENVIKEADEEAGIPSEMSRQATSTGCLSQMTSKGDGSCMKYSKYYIWDLEVLQEFRPYAKDGEVQRFEVWDADQLLQEVKEGNRLRPAMRLVVTDFLIRHGIITPDKEPQLSEIQAAMHRERLTFLSDGG